MENQMLQFGNNRGLLIFAGKKKTVSERALSQKNVLHTDIIISNRPLWSHFEGGRKGGKQGDSHIFCYFEIYLAAVGKYLSPHKSSDILHVNFPSYFLEKKKPWAEILVSFKSHQQEQCVSNIFPSTHKDTHITKNLWIPSYECSN